MSWTMSTRWKNRVPVATGGPSIPPYMSSALLYDDLLGRRMLPLFLRNLLRLASRYAMSLGRVADVGCGTGRFVAALVRGGIRAVGVDRSPTMIRLARRSRGLPAGTFGVQDLRHLRLPARMDVITCNFDVVNYLLSPPELLAAFRSIRRNLAPGGHFLFDVVVDDPGLRRPRPPRVSRMRAHGVESVWIVAVHPRARIRRVTLWIRPVQPGVGGWKREVHVQRAHPVTVLLAALRRAGLSPRGVHDAATLRPYRRGDRRVVFVAWRRPRRRRRRSVPDRPVGGGPESPRS